MEAEDSIIISIDEVGFGTSVLRKYAYSHIGSPVVLERGKKLQYNVTCTAAM